MKDLSRIDRQIESLMRQISPLKSDLATALMSQAELKTELQHYDAECERKLRSKMVEWSTQEYHLKEVSSFCFGFAWFCNRNEFDSLVLTAAARGAFMTSW